MMMRSILFFFWLLTVLGLNAQKQALEISQLTNNGPQQKIYLVTDKFIYTANEQLWFSAYLIETRAAIKDTADVVTMGLYNPVSEKIVLLKKFPLQNNTATGNMILPDSLLPGQYILIAYSNITDASNKPIGIGFKPIKIYTQTGSRSFTSLLKIVDSLSGKDTIAISHEIVAEKYQVTFPNTQVNYALTNAKRRKLSVDSYGKGIIYINSKEIKTKDRSLIVTTIYNNETVNNQIKLPEHNQRKNDTTLSLYPESGILTAGYSNRIFWESTSKNVPVSLPALLMEDDKVIDTLYSSKNRTNAFYLQPIAGKQYSLIAGLKETGMPRFNLPVVDYIGIRFKIPDIVVNDSLVFEVASREKKAATLIIVDVNESASFHALDLHDYRRVKISLEFVPRGLCKLFIIDSNKTLLARSFFFAHYNNRNNLRLNTDKVVYKTRDSVQLSMSINNSKMLAQNAIATISCVLQSRIDFRSIKNLESDHDLQSTVFTEASFYKRRNILDSLLLLEHILRMKNIGEEHLKFLKQSSQPINLSKSGVHLYLTRDGVPIRRALNLVLIRDRNYSRIRTNGEGRLTLSFNDLLVNDGRHISVKENRAQNDNYYHILTEDPLIRAYKNIKIPLYNPVFREQAPDLTALLKTDMQERFSKNLEEVVVRSGRGISAIGAATPCGDYVCQFNVLNCGNHTVPYKRPVKGERYRGYSQMIVYEGCNLEDKTYLPPSTPIYLPLAFLGMDSSLLREEHPEYLSTLWWQPFKKLSKEADNQIRFHTSDQKGVYLITVQGFAENGQPFYGEKTIRVED